MDPIHGGGLCFVLSPFVVQSQRAQTSSVSDYVRNIKRCMGISKSLNIVKLHRVMPMLKLQINVNLPQLLCIVAFFLWLRLKIANFERFGGFALNVTVRYRRRRVVTVNAKLTKSGSKLAILSHRNDNTQQLR